jgi:hypothetical protein
MIEMNWKEIRLMPQNIPLETIDSSGNVQKLIRKGERSERYVLVS